ncbi:hypothetical protein ACWD3Z_00790 [Streptomyces sp. NPDC002740]
MQIYFLQSRLDIKGVRESYYGKSVIWTECAGGYEIDRGFSKITDGLACSQVQNLQGPSPDYRPFAMR